MVEVILIAIFALMALLGLTELIHGIGLIAVAPEKPYKTFSLICLKDKNAAHNMSFAAHQQRWLGSRFADYLIAVDYGLDEEQLNECILAAERYNIIICHPDSLNKVINNLSRG